jgi:hypothetical protein
MAGLDGGGEGSWFMFHVTGQDLMAGGIRIAGDVNGF